MAYGAAMEVCAPYSTLAHSSHGSERQAMYEAQKERGMKGFLEVRDGKFLPEPFGPKSKLAGQKTAGEIIGGVRLRRLFFFP